MRKRLMLAILLAAVSAISLYLYTVSLREESEGGQKVTVLVAAQDLKQGTRITTTNRAYQEIPRAYLHPGSIRKQDENIILGQPVSADIKQGQQLLLSDFDSPKTRGARRLSQQVQKGQRAMTIPVDLSGSLAGMLRPGDHVDLLGTFARGQGTDWTTVTLLQNVLVLAVGSSSETEAEVNPNRPFSSITVSVDLEEAELLAFAVQRGPVNIALRSSEDILTVEDVPDKNFGDVFEVQKRTAFAHRKMRKIEALKAAQ